VLALFTGLSMTIVTTGFSLTLGTRGSPCLQRRRPAGVSSLAVGFGAAAQSLAAYPVLTGPGTPGTPGDTLVRWTGLTDRWEALANERLDPDWREYFAGGADERTPRQRDGVPGGTPPGVSSAASTRSRPRTVLGRELAARSSSLGRTS
jgi:hypothetical protein